MYKCGFLIITAAAASWAKRVVRESQDMTNFRILFFLLSQNCMDRKTIEKEDTSANMEVK